MTNASLLLSEGRLNLQRLLWLRLIILPGVLLAIWWADRYLSTRLPITAMLAAVVVMMMICIATLVRMQRAWPVTNVELFAQMLLDVLLLTVLLHFSGGSTNPFAPAYLLPLVMTAVVLPSAYVWWMFVFTAGCYSFLLFFYVPLPTGHGHDFQLHVWGMWAGFLFSAGLIAGFSTRVAATVKVRDKMIAGMREQQHRHQQVVALGTLAAGAAHDLGTPLSTIRVLVSDLEPDEPVTATTLETLTEQINRCKSILSSLSTTAGDLRPEDSRPQPLDLYLNTLVKKWQETRLNIEITLTVKGNQPAPVVVIDRTLDQAIFNVLNNAADVSDHVEIKLAWDDERLDITVSDRGPGFAREIVDAAGKIIVSTKQEGLGVGLYLSYTTFERFGGDIRLYNRDDGGARCHIHLPLPALIV